MISTILLLFCILYTLYLSSLLPRSPETAPPHHHHPHPPPVMPPTSKRGLCWPTTNQDPIHPFTKPNSHITWLYNWSPNPSHPDSSLEFVPMLWNHHTPLPPTSSAPPKHLLAFNEPDLPSQANMPPSLAAATWLEKIEPLRKQGTRCGSPGISSAEGGVPWLLEFLRLVREGGGGVDFYCFHWYGVEVGQFYDWIWSAYFRLPGHEEEELGRGRKKVWITEYASTNWSTTSPLSHEHVLEFARHSARYLDTLDWVERYAWFGAMRDTGTVGPGARMLDDEGKLTELGRVYRDA